MKILIFKSEFDLMLMLAGTLFQSWIRLENLNLVILSGLGPPKYALDTHTPFVLHFGRISRFFWNLLWHCLALSLHLYVWTRTKWVSCTFILYEQHSLPSRIYCIIQSVWLPGLMILIIYKLLTISVRVYAIMQLS